MLLGWSRVTRIQALGCYTLIQKLIRWQMYIQGAKEHTPMFMHDQNVM